ncbi:RyR domain-containing protein [Oligosphaera ethanolica]|uniref:Uncharacterized protein n=1 Tax=Oligosphaera ethanolica TaxID=760260 RepID=A0AAE3VJZ0_9BACT|nr:RyR domain-containing protein [Oligosphaera ethanolica]MDQ0291578.1 hypothetical protein [Oligosphaera ethanolica]
MYDSDTKKEMKRMAKRILVTGDFVLDNHVYEGQRQNFCDKQVGVRVVRQLGGAALVHDLLSALLGEGAKTSLDLGVKLPTGVDKIRPELVPDTCQAYAFWKPFDKVWRTESGMGFGGDCSKGAPDVKWPPYKVAEQAPEVLVLCDGGLGFRDSSENWSTRDLDAAEFIVLKSTAPLQRGALWEKLVQPEYAGKLVITVGASDLRRSDALVNRGMSWEDTLESLASELAPGGDLEALTKCRHLVIAFESEGALWIDIGGPPGVNTDTLDRVRCQFVYRTDSIEGEQRKNTKGTAFGFLSCITAAVAWHLAKGASLDMPRAMEGGLSAMSRLLLDGHGPSSRPGNGFPVERLAKCIKNVTCAYSRAVFQLTDVCHGLTCPMGASAAGAAPQPQGCWSLLRTMLLSSGSACTDPADDLAKRVVEDGMIALANVPHLRKGLLFSVDRREIEGMRGISGIVQEYRDKKGAKKPLSIGVFGPPGSGKSFAVEEIVKAELGEKVPFLEFNLSQFNDAEDLIGAFHQVRDEVLKGETPVAFFDEFDAQQYKWLQYLLAPMQDGSFQDGQLTHPIGKSIFIFAGGTSLSFQTFGPPDPDTLKTKPTPEEEEAYSQFKFAKGPDFQSRLDGFINVNGPNRRVLPEERDKQVTDPCDIFFPLRRAFIIRGEFRTKPAQKLDLDDGLLEALIRADGYRHGSRSLSKVLDPLKSHLKQAGGRLLRSLIPPRDLLNLYTNADEFMRLCRSVPPHRPVDPLLTDPAKLEKVAKAIHDTWENLGVAEGWRKPADAVSFSDLSAFYHGSNIAAAKRIPAVLAFASLKLVDGKNTPDERERICCKMEYHLELMAENEHDRWMEWHLSQNWRWGEQKDPAKLTEEPEIKTHPCLIPYSELSDEERNKDRNCIRHYPDFADAAGMKIVDA